MTNKKFLFIFCLGLLFSSLSASPHKHRMEDKEAEGPKEVKKATSIRLSQVRDSTWIGKDDGMRIFKENDYRMYGLPFALMAVYTNNPRHVTPSGAIRFLGLSLSSDTLLSLHFKALRNITFNEITLRFQLEGVKEKSVFKNVHIDNMATLCPKHGRKLICTETPINTEDSEYGAGWMVIDGIPVPTFKDFEFGSSGVGSLRVWLEDDEDTLLMEGRFFVTKDE